MLDPRISQAQIQVLNGVVLISWRQTVLQKQIDYGVSLQQVVLSLARMELDIFFQHTMAVAEYYDQSHMLVAVSVTSLNQYKYCSQHVIFV